VVDNLEEEELRDLEEGEDDVEREDESERDLSEDLPPFEDDLGGPSVDAEEPEELPFRTEKSRTSETIDG